LANFQVGTIRAALETTSLDSRLGIATSMDPAITLLVEMLDFTIRLAATTISLVPVLVLKTPPVATTHSLVVIQAAQ
jgi:hypothetical protein